MKHAFYAQSGGATAVINASAWGEIETARAQSDKIGTVYAGQNGIIGALSENLIDTSIIILALPFCKLQVNNSQWIESL